MSYVCPHSCTPHPSQQRLPYAQMIIGLDKLFFTAKLLETDQEVQDRSETIEAYLEACGWNWDSVVEHLINEDRP